MNGYKLLFNKTTHDIVLTLYIRSQENIEKNFGTKIIPLKSGESMEVEFGNLHNAFLNGIKVQCNINGLLYSHQNLVSSNDSVFDRLLNNSRTLTITNISPIEFG